jgi:hypothetical protein
MAICVAIQMRTLESLSKPTLKLLFGILLGVVTASAAARASDLITPDPNLTPGAVLPVTAVIICQSGYTKSVRHVDRKTKAQVYREYGIGTHQPGRYEVDHLISLGLGGSNDIKNLWPQSFETQPWNAHLKDRLEGRLHKLVCNGDISLLEAQRAVADDWIGAYNRYVGGQIK